MCTEPGGDPAGSLDRAELRELGLPVETVARLRLEGGRPGPEHPAPVTTRRGRQIFLGGGPGRADGREDAAAGRVQLLVGGAARPERELLYPVAGEAGVRVAVDEAGDRRQAARVELFDLPVERFQVAHPADRGDAAVLAEDVRVLDHLDLVEGVAAARPAAAGRRGELGEVADEEAAHCRRRPTVPDGRRTRRRSGAPASSRVLTPLPRRADRAPGRARARSLPRSPRRRGASRRVPGSAVSTRRSRSSASAEPSATTTIPAWIELPIPTPPPWWTLTQVAPAATLSNALRIGQSAIASEPSAIASVSR